LLSLRKGGEVSEPGSVDELSTGHFNMPYDMVREGKKSLISVNFLVCKILLCRPSSHLESSVALLPSFHAVAVNITH